MTEKEEEDNQQLEDDGVESVLKQQWRRYLNALSIFWKMCGEPKESVNVNTLAYGGRLLQRDGLRKSYNVETKAVESESFESDNIKVVVEQWERQFYVLNVFQEMYNSIEVYKDVYIPVSERRVQWKSNENKYYLQQRTRLQGEIDELWKPMSFSKISYS